MTTDSWEVDDVCLLPLSLIFFTIKFIFAYKFRRNIFIYWSYNIKDVFHLVVFIRKNIYGWSWCVRVFSSMNSMKALKTCIYSKHIMHLNQINFSFESLGVDRVNSMSWPLFCFFQPKLKALSEKYICMYMYYISKVCV